MPGSAQSPDASSLHAQLVPPVSHALRALSAILDKAEAHCAAHKIDPAALLTFRLFPDMLPFTRQIQIGTDMARRGAARLAGTEPASVPDTETSFADLRERIALTLRALEATTPASLDGATARTISFKAGPREVTFSGADYLRLWILPNFYFHATTAYAILRHNGVPLGKADFLGG